MPKKTKLYMCWIEDILNFGPPPEKPRFDVTVFYVDLEKDDADIVLHFVKNSNLENVYTNKDEAIHETICKRLGRSWKVDMNDYIATLEMVAYRNWLKES